MELRMIIIWDHI